jgi:hypothetical protein
MAKCRREYRGAPFLKSNRQRSALVALLISLGAGAADDRRVYEGGDHWLAAVGRLQVPSQRRADGTRRHFVEDCSATLLARPGAAYADTVVTAWHCLENYHDLSRPITFTPDRNRSPAVIEAHRLADGGGMHADWAILRLRQRLPARTALTAHPGRADAARVITMAGFSRDGGTGQRGEWLTYDPHCRIIHQTAETTDTDCRAYRGASGGAVVQLSGDGLPMYSGVVSEGDGDGFSRYVPVSRFRITLQRALNE